MKKTLFLFVVALMSLWVSAQAQETISFNDFFMYSSDEGYYHFINAQDVISNLKSKGYELTSSSKVKISVYDPVGPKEYVDEWVPREVFSKNGINIILLDGRLTEIVFDNKSQLNNFLAQMKAKGWDGEDNIYGWQKFNYGQPIMATVDGLKIIFDLGE